MAVETVSSRKVRSTKTQNADVRGYYLPKLGAHIRSLRAKRGLSIVEVARQIGVSASLISQVERGLIAPSLDVLWGLARFLELPMGAFFEDSMVRPDEQVPTVERPSKAAVVRAGARKKLAFPESMVLELLSPDLKHQIELVWTEYAPGQKGPEAPFVHAGEEQMVVLRGVIHFWVDGEEYVLHAGDAITIDSSLPHRVSNQGSEPATVVAAMTPPSF